MSTDNEMIQNTMWYFSEHISTTEDWKKLYNALSNEILCCKETDNVVLGNVKKSLINRSLMYLWKRENIFKIMALVKEETLSFLGDREN